MRTKNNLKTATLLTALLLSPLTTNAEIIVGIDDGHGNTINTQITDHNGNPIDIHNTNPSTSAYVAYNLNADLLINNGTSLNIKNLIIANNEDTFGSITVQGQNSKLLFFFSGGLQVGAQGTGTLNINNGAAITTSPDEKNRLYIGIASSRPQQNTDPYTATGTINLQDQGSYLKASHLAIGTYGQGTLNIKNGATADIAEINIGDQNRPYNSNTITTNGTLNIHDQNTKLISYRLNILEGTLNIENGATVETKQEVNIGSINSISNSIANITGQNTTWNIKQLNLNSNQYIQRNQTPSSTLNILDGATVNTETANLGEYGLNNTINIKGQNSTLNISQAAYQRYQNDSITINIENGGTYNSVNMNINGGSYSNKSIINVKGINSNLNVTAELTLSYANLNVSHNASVTSQSIGINDTGDTITLDNGTLNFDQIYPSTFHSIKGNGTINTKSFILNQEITLDNPNDLNFSYNDVNNNHNLKINLDLSQTQYQIVAGGTGTETGTLNIKNGVQIKSTYGYIGYRGQGTINAQDNETKLTINDKLYVGRYDNFHATLNITNNAIVDTGTLHIGKKGEINIDNATLNVSYLDTKYLVQNKITGSGTINTNGIIYDQTVTLQNQTDLFNSTTLTNDNQNFTINTDLSKTSYLLGAGNTGQGTLNIKNGIQINAITTTIGNLENSDGTINVQGQNTKLTTQNLYVGRQGVGTLNITNGAKVSTNELYSNNGIINIQNENSTLTINHAGRGSIPILNISDHAQVIFENYTRFYSETIFNLSINSTEETLIEIKNSIYLAGTLNILTDELSNLNYQDTFTLINIEGQRQGTFQNLQEGDIATTAFGYDLIISYYGGDGNDITLTAIPEPTTLFTILTLAPTLLTRRKK